MRPSNLDNLPENVQKAIYHVFSNISVRDKIIFLSKLEYGNDLTYREISEMTGITFQRTQQLYDGYIGAISNLVHSSGVMLSGVII
jgi:DNA-directed RNA polymerase specialized sigma subunit